MIFYKLLFTTLTLQTMIWNPHSKSICTLYTQGHCGDALFGPPKRDRSTEGTREESQLGTTGFPVRKAQHPMEQFHESCAISRMLPSSYPKKGVNFVDVGIFWKWNTWIPAKKIMINHWKNGLFPSSSYLKTWYMVYEVYDHPSQFMETQTL